MSRIFSNTGCLSLHVQQAYNSFIIRDRQLNNFTKQQQKTTTKMTLKTQRFFYITAMIFLIFSV